MRMLGHITELGINEGTVIMMGAKLVLIGFLVSAILALLGQATEVVTALGNALQYGALGILGLTDIGLFLVILQLIRGYNELATRWDSWEQLRHKDHEELNRTMTSMTANCAAVNKGK